MTPSQVTMQAMVPGSMVTLCEKREDRPIYARRTPQRLLSGRGGIMEPEQVGTIPHMSRLLYISSKVDAFSSLMAGKKGPFGFKPGDITFHLVMWGDRPVWVSSEDCELRR